MEAQKCSERGCPFPPAPGETLCRQHVEMFAFEESLYESSIDATEEDIASAIFYDESVSVKKRGIVPLDEWFENREWKKTLAQARSLNNVRKCRERRRSAGLCVSCGISKASSGVTYCEGCAQKAYELYRARREKLRLAGFCFRCMHANDTDGFLCSNCVSENRKARKRLLALGLCAVCRHPRNGAKVLCVACADKHRLLLLQRYAKLRDSALCPGCGLPKTSPTIYCDDCKRRASEAMKRTRVRRREARLCYYCGNPALPRRSRCIKCADFHEGYAKQRKQSFIAAGLCAWCGKRPLSPPRQLCTVCSEKNHRASNLSHAKQRNRFRAAGHCIICGHVKNNPTERCDRCRKKHNKLARTRARVSNKSKVPASRRRTTSGEAVFAVGCTGTCRQCGEKTELGRKYCSACVRRCNSLNRRLKEHRKSAGLCVRCGKERDTKYLRCSACAKRANEYKKKLRRSKRVPAAIGGGMEEGKNENEKEGVSREANMLGNSKVEVGVCNSRHSTRQSDGSQNIQSLFCQVSTSVDAQSFGWRICQAGEVAARPSGRWTSL